MTFDGPREEVEARLRALLDSYGVFLRRTVERLCARCPGVSADDVEQEARTKVWRALQGEREITNPPSFLHRVAVNATLDAIRQIKARREESVTIGRDDENGGPLATIAADAGERPDRVVERRELREAVATALASLHATRRRPVALHLQGFSSEEIARLLGFTEPKARNLVYRGLEDLRRALRSAGIEGEP